MDVSAEKNLINNSMSKIRIKNTKKGMWTTQQVLLEANNQCNED